MVRKWIAAASLLVVTVPAGAQDLIILPRDSILVAAAEQSTPAPTVTESNASPAAAAVEERRYTRNKWHQYLSLGSISLAGLTIIAPKPDAGEDEGIHPTLARGAAALGVAAAATGVAYHWDDIDFSKGFSDPDNLHATLAALSALGFLAAVSEAPDSAHAGIGGAAAVSMALAIKIAW